MKIDFSQTAEHSIKGKVDADFVSLLPEVIFYRTGLRYTCTQTADGWVLNPMIRNLYYRNSFVPEIDARILQNNGQTVLHMTGRPVKFLLSFMRFWFVSLLIIEALLLIAVALSGFEKLFAVFIPVVMGILGYLLCKIATKATFCVVVKAIQKELP